RCPIDENEGVVKSKVFLGRARAPLGSAPELGCEDQDSGISLAAHLRWNNSFHHPSIRLLLSAMMLNANLQPPSPVRKRKTAFWFSKRGSASCTGRLEARAPNQVHGLARFLRQTLV